MDNIETSNDTEVRKYYESLGELFVKEQVADMASHDRMGMFNI